MSSAPLNNESPARTPRPAIVPMKFEVTVIPVSDVDRAEAFYQKLGWRLDFDFDPTKNTRGLQFTPPGSRASIQFGSGLPSKTPPGSMQGLLLVVDDLEAARRDLIARGIAVGEVFHVDYEKGPVRGSDPQHRSYFSRAAFKDPDGNEWHLREIKERLPGRA